MSSAAEPARVLDIESLEQEARGVGHWQGKTIFVDGALPGERIEFSPYRRKPSYEFARPVRFLHETAQRVQPRCPHFGVCGGCSLQHYDVRAQVAAKQRILEDALSHIGRVRPEHILQPIYGPAWEYRQRARFTVRNVPKKGGVLVGFHERRSSYVADMASCEVVPARISGLLPGLRSLVASLSVRDRLPQIEIACGDEIDALVLRILEPLTADDGTTIKRFADEHNVVVYLQRAGPESARLFHPISAPELTYRIPEFELNLRFGPTEFTQVNSVMNRALLSRAVRLLDPMKGEKIADLFCGLGNFSLAIARSDARVIGMETAPTMVERARENAERNGLARACRFLQVDLFRHAREAMAAEGPFDRMLIDPPRDGAIEVIKSLREPLARRIVYVSCNPATLARDAGVLVQVLGYRLVSAGIVNMFPHTAHVESLAVFERDRAQDVVLLSNPK